jgi:four helix bundle protein
MPRTDEGQNGGSLPFFVGRLKLPRLATMENFRNLLVWQRSIALAVVIAKATRELPHYERDELGKQMRRSARSVHANIAEASGRKVAGRSNADGLRCLAISSGELHELDSDVEYAMRAEYWPEAVAKPLLREIAEIRRMLAAFIAHRRRETNAANGRPTRSESDRRSTTSVNLSTRQPVNLSTPPPGPDPSAV